MLCKEKAVAFWAVLLLVMFHLGTPKDTPYAPITQTQTKQQETK